MTFTFLGLSIGKARPKRLYGAAAAAAQGKNTGGGRKKGGKSGKTIEKEEQKLALALKRLSIEAKKIELEDKRAQLEARRERRDQNPMQELRAAMKMQRELSRDLKELAGEETGGGDGIQGMVAQFIKPLGQGLGQALGVLAQQQMAAQQPVGVVQQPQQIPQKSSYAQSPGTTPAQPVAEQIEEPINLTVERIKRELTSKNPHDAAVWIAQQKGMLEAQVKNALINTQDDQIPQLIPQVRNFSPDMAAWLGERIPWLVQVAHELRAMQAVPNPQAAGNVSPL